MKDTIKFIGLFVVGLITAVFVYPIMHELGHLIVALLLDVKIIDINLFPLSYIICDFEGIGDLGVAAVGLGGALLPFIVSCVVKPNNFWLWYSNVLIQFISLLSFLVSGISAIVFIFTNSTLTVTDDVVQMLNLSPKNQWFVMLFIVLLTAVATIKLMRSKLFTRVLQYYI